MIKKIKKTVSQTYVAEDLNGEELVGTFSEKEMQKTNQTKFTVVKGKKAINYI